MESSRKIFPAAVLILLLVVAATGTCFLYMLTEIPEFYCDKYLISARTVFTKDDA
jgi:hypothetical protein